MQRFLKRVIFLLFLSYVSLNYAATLETSAPKFVALALGVENGSDQDNLSTFLFAPVGSNDWVALEAGTLLPGLKAVNQSNHSFALLNTPDMAKFGKEQVILRDNVKAFLLSESYLNRVLGLVLNPPDVGAKKPLLGLPDTLKEIKTQLFNEVLSPRFGDNKTGQNRYGYEILTDNKRTQIAKTELFVRAFPLSRGQSPNSTAFLLETKGEYALYIGNTNLSESDGSGNFQNFWEKRILPIVQQQRLRGIFMDVGYPDGYKSTSLENYLTPSLVMSTLSQLAKLVSPHAPQHALKGLTVIISGIRPSFNAGVNSREIIQSQLNQQNNLGIRFVIPVQGQRIEF